MRKSSVTSRSSFPSGASSCQIDFFRLARRPSSPRSLPSTPCVVPSRCFRKYSWPLPDEPSRLERQTNRLRGQFFGLSGSSQRHLQRAGLQLFRATYRPGSMSRRLRPSGHRQRVGLAAAARKAASPCARRGRCSRSGCRPSPRSGAVGDRISPTVERLVAPLIGVGIEERGGVHLPRRTAPVEREGQRQPSRSAAAAFPGPT